MRPTEEGRAKLKADCLKGVVESPLDSARKALLQYVIESYLTLSPGDQEQFERLSQAPEYHAMIELRSPAVRARTLDDLNQSLDLERLQGGANNGGPDLNGSKE